MGQVVEFIEPDRRFLIETLKALVDEAEAGDLTGVFFVAIHKDKTWGNGYVASTSLDACRLVLIAQRSAQDMRDALIGVDVI